MAAALLLSGCDWAVLNPKGPVGDGNATILIDSVAIMLAIVVPTIVATLAAAWWYRSSNTRARYLPDFEYSGALELIVWAIPLLTIMLLGGVAWIGSHDLDPARPLVSKEEPLNVQVVSLDWKWLFIYPDQHVASVNRLVIPAGTPIHFTLTSGSVMTAFFVPQLGSMIYTMNRMGTQLHLLADHPGAFRGLATQLSGDGFADMHFEVVAKTAAEFYDWLGKTRATGQNSRQSAISSCRSKASCRSRSLSRRLQTDCLTRSWIRRCRRAPARSPRQTRVDPATILRTGELNRCSAS